MIYGAYGLGILTIWGGLLTGCSGSDTPPTLEIASPTSGSTVTGVAQIQLSAEDDNSVSSVDVYVRPLNSTAIGQKVGSSNKASSGGGTPTGGTTDNSKSAFVVSWNTQTLPNLLTLELYATATDDGGKVGKAEAIQVTVTNANAPFLRYFASLTLPPLAEVAPTSRSFSLEQALGKPLQSVIPPLPSLEGGRSPQSSTAPKLRLDPVPISTRATTTSNRRNIVEWAWEAQSGIRGYNIYLSPGDLLGPYTKQIGVRPDGVGTGLQKYSKLLEGADLNLKSTYFGTVSSLGSAGEGARSNTYPTHFLPEQLLETPAAAAVLPDGKPTLTWTANSDTDVVGYYFFIYKRDPVLFPQDVPVWTNSSGRTTSQLSVKYPDARAPLEPGTYFWWVAGVSFNEEGGPSGFSFSNSSSFQVQGSGTAGS